MTRRGFIDCVAIGSVGLLVFSRLRPTPTSPHYVQWCLDSGVKILPGEYTVDGYKLYIRRDPVLDRCTIKFTQPHPPSDPYWLDISPCRVVITNNDFIWPGSGYWYWERLPD